MANYTLFRNGSSTCVEFPCGTLLLISDAGKSDFVDHVPKGFEELKPYPYTGIEKIPPSSIFPIVDATYRALEYARRRTEDQKSAA